MLSYKTISNIGGRKLNEDSYVCLEQGDSSCFVVADGLGGHGKGDIASRMLVETFQRVFKACHTDTETFLQAAFDSAQEEILAAQKDVGAMNEMKTTAVALIIIDNRCRWGHIGDSRLYMFSKNRVKTRTLDHSVPQMLVYSKEIKERDIARHPDRNRLLRAVGVEWDFPKYDLSDECELKSCQAFLMCSDGFWENIDQKKMGTFLKKSTSVEEWLAMMTHEVETNGSEKEMDNYTAIAVWC